MQNFSWGCITAIGYSSLLSTSIFTPGTVERISLPDVSLYYSNNHLPMDPSLKVFTFLTRHS